MRGHLFYVLYFEANMTRSAKHGHIALLLVRLSNFASQPEQQCCKYSRALVHPNLPRASGSGTVSSLWERVIYLVQSYHLLPPGQTTRWGVVPHCLLPPKGVDRWLLPSYCSAVNCSYSVCLMLTRYRNKTLDLSLMTMLKKWSSTPAVQPNCSAVVLFAIRELNTL